MTSFHPLLADRVFNVPLMVHPQKALVIAGVLRRQWGLDGLVLPTVAGPIDEAVLREGYGGGYTFDEAAGIAQIDVSGTLVHKNRYIRADSGILGYDGIGAQLDAALADPRVLGIIMDFHSTGGEVSGCFGLTDRIYEARQIKPIVAVVDEHALSAAYCLASACNEIWLASETAWAGSIGVLTMHADFSRAMDAEGVTVTLIHAGERKKDGNEFEPLPDGVKASFQARIDKMRELFVERVARNRGLSPDKVMATKAASYMGRDALDQGLADGIKPPAQVYREFSEVLRRR